MAQPRQAGGIGPGRDGVGYLPALDGLRAVAILLVIGAHAGLDHVLPGAFGVTLFFFISGYLITRQLLYGLAARGRIALGGFYLRRVLRLLPACVVYIAISGFAFTAAGGHIALLGWVAALGYGANIYDLWIGYRSSLPGVRHPFNILWSLAIEEQFYAVWPLLIAAARSRRAMLGAMILLCLGVLAWRGWLFFHCGGQAGFDLCGRVQADPRWRYNRLYLGTDTRIDSLAWGAMLAIAAQRHPDLVYRTGRGVFPIAIALALLAGSFWLPGAFARQVLRTSLQGCAMLVLMPAVIGTDHALARVLSLAPALAIGRLSYSLYLWHWGGFAVADFLAGGNRALWLAIALPAATLLAGLSYGSIERPMLRWRRRAGSHAPLSLAAPRPMEQERRHAAT